VRCFIRDRTLYVDREAYKVGCEIDDTPALFDTLDPSRPGMARLWTVVADSARPETISYMQRHGYPRIQPAKKGQGSVEEGITFLQNYNIVVHPRCTHTIDELTLYSYQRDRLTNAVLPILEDKKNHVIDALRYAVETLRLVKPAVAVIRAQPDHSRRIYR
jgi:phage terminase large subunit